MPDMCIATAGAAHVEAAVEYDHVVRYPLDAAKADKKRAHFYPTVFFVLNAWNLAAFAMHQAVLDEFARRIVTNNSAWKGARTWQLLQDNLGKLHRKGVLTLEQGQHLAKALSRQMKEDATSSSPQSALAAPAPGLDLLGDWPTSPHQTVQQQPIDQHADAAAAATEQPGHGGLVLPGSLVPQHAGLQQWDTQLPAAPPGVGPIQGMQQQQQQLGNWPTSPHQTVQQQSFDQHADAAAAATEQPSQGGLVISMLAGSLVPQHAGLQQWDTQLPAAPPGLDLLGDWPTSPHQTVQQQPIDQHADAAAAATEQPGQGGLVLPGSLVPQHAGLQQWDTQLPAAPPGAAPTADAQGPAAAAAAALEAGGVDKVAKVDRDGYVDWADDFVPTTLLDQGMDQEQGQGDEQSLGPEPGQEQGQQQAQHMAQNMELDAGQEEQPQSQAQEQVHALMGPAGAQLGQLGPSPEGLREAHLKGLVLQCLARSTAVVVKYRDMLTPWCAAWAECNNVENDNNKAVQQLQQMNQLPAHPGGHLLPP